MAPSSASSSRQGSHRHRAASGVHMSEPTHAHAFFLSFSISKMVQFVYRPNTYDKTPLRAIVANYVRIVASRHPYWNRSATADHFMLAYHDWVSVAASPLAMKSWHLARSTQMV